MTTRPFTPTRLDLAIIAFLLPAGFARAHQIVAWLDGPSGSAVSKRLTALKRAGILDTWPVSAYLDNGHGGVKLTAVTVWYVNPNGVAEYGRPVTVPGSGAVVELGPLRKCRPATVDHSLAVVDAAICYRRFGYEIAWERQILATERETPNRDGGMVSALIDPYWTVPVDSTPDKLLERHGRARTRRPDLGAVRGSLEIAIEVEISPKDALEVRGAIEGHFYAAEHARAQAWHVVAAEAWASLDRAINGDKKRKLPPMRELALEKHDGYWASRDGRVRIARVPAGHGNVPAIATLGRIGGIGVEDLYPAKAPLGFPGQRGAPAGDGWRTAPARNLLQVIRDGLGDRPCARTLGYDMRKFPTPEALADVLDQVAALPADQLPADLRDRIRLAHAAWIRAVTALGRDGARVWWSTPLQLTDGPTSPMRLVHGRNEALLAEALRSLPSRRRVEVAEAA